MVYINPSYAIFEHSKRTAVLAELIAKQMCFPKKGISIIKRSALYHDIGKLWLDKAILGKRSSLSQEQFEVVKRHTIYGYNILSSNEMHYEALAALLHHERLDGSGYPLGLSGHDIPVYIRIISIADVFSALTEYRPYRKRKYSFYEALDILCDHQKYDGKVVAALARCTKSFKEVLECQNIEEELV